MLPLDTVFFDIIFDAINGSNKEMNLYDYTNSTMWKDMLNAVCVLDDYDDYNYRFTREIVVKDIVDCYAITTAIINTPNEEKIMMDILRRKYNLAVESFEEDFMNWYNAVNE